VAVSHGGPRESEPLHEEPELQKSLLWSLLHLMANAPLRGQQFLENDDFLLMARETTRQSLKPPKLLIIESSTRIVASSQPQDGAARLASHAQLHETHQICDRSLRVHEFLVQVRFGRFHAAHHNHNSVAFDVNTPLDGSGQASHRVAFWHIHE